MMTVEEIRTALADRVLNLAAVARATGLSSDTIYRVRDEVGTPSYGTLKALSDFFRKGPSNGQV